MEILGYAFRTVPSGVTSVSSSTIPGSGLLELTTVKTDLTIGNITVPNYNITPTYAYIEFVGHAHYDDSGVANRIDTADSPYIQMGTPNFSCGSVPSRSWINPGNQYFGNWKIRMTTNIASNISPNTTYACTFKNALATADSIFLVHPQIVLNLFYLR